MPNEDVFPALVCCANLHGMKDTTSTLFDVKFYPYPTVDGDQIFAAAGERHVTICRMVRDGDRPFEILRWFFDENEQTSINSLVWTKDPVTRKPLLCLAGSKPTHVRIIDIDTGEPVRTLSGHGKAINDLALSPLSPNIIASASEDYTIRLWNLDPKHEEQPCVAVLSGEGHKQPLLAINFHPNGRWLLSGGFDTAVCLWAVPSLDELDRKDVSEDDLQQHQDPKIVYYPHFVSTEVHHDYLDSLQFYGDLILSKSARKPSPNNKNNVNEILLWKIEGFDPDESPAAQPPIPTPGVYTRSSFDHPPRSAGFQRLLSFRVDHTIRFYHSFGLYCAPGKRPILCMGNEESKFYFWDLQGLEEGKIYHKEKAGKKGKGKKNMAASVSSENLHRLNGSNRADSVASESTGTGAGKSTPLASTPSISTPAPNPNPDRKPDLSDPFRKLDPHNVQVAGTQWTTFTHGKKKEIKHFATSRLAWSPDGRWLVAVGDVGMMCVFYRGGVA